MPPNRTWHGSLFNFDRDQRGVNINLPYIYSYTYVIDKAWLWGGGAIVSQNLWYWGDESSINTGSGYWEDKGIGGNDAVLNGTISSFTNSGSLGVAFNGTDNWLNWNTSSFADIEDGYTIQFTFSPSWALSTINGYANSLKTFSLWNSETNNFSQLINAIRLKTCVLQL